MSVSDSVSYQQLCLKTAAGAACALLLLGSGIRSASAAAQLVVEPITWDVIGLDHNAVNTGPNEFPVGARVRNIGDEPATNVTVQFHWLSSNQFINLTPPELGSTDVLTTPSIAPGASGLFYFNVTVTRTPAAHFTSREFQITASADSIPPVSGPVRQLYVEKILSQSRNDVLSFTGPDTVEVGQVYQFMLQAKTATNGYEQLQVFINFPNSIFRIISINAHYSAPRNGGAGFTNDIDYADACGWDPINRVCGAKTGCPIPGCKAGGQIDTVYTVQVIRNLETTLSLTTLIHDFSGSSYHYNSDFGVTKTIVPVTDLEIRKTAIPETVEAGTTFSYQITAVNGGGRDAENVMVTDTLPDGVGFVSANPPPISMADSNPQVWNLGTLPAGQEETIIVVAEALCSAIPEGSRSAEKVNTAILQTSTQEMSLDNNTATATVTIQDTMPPAIFCPPDLAVDNDPGVCGADGVIGIPVTSDNCGTRSLIGVRSDGLPLTAPYPVGTTTVTWTVTDSHQNATSCTQTVTVRDTEPPSIICPDDLIVDNTTSMCSALVEVGVPATDDNCATYSLTSERSDGLSLTAPYPVGNTSITWTVTDIHQNATSCTQTVTVNDTEPPSIVCGDDLIVGTETSMCTALADIPFPTADDNCAVASVTFVRSDGGQLPDPFPAGTTTITWTVIDVHGNSTSCTQAVTVVDQMAPEITCPPDICRDLIGRSICEAPIEPGMAQGSDNCSSVTITASRDDGLMLGDPYPVGTTIITWQATDMSGNVSTCTQSITYGVVTCPPAEAAIAGTPATAGLFQATSSAPAADHRQRP